MEERFLGKTTEWRGEVPLGGGDGGLQTKGPLTGGRQHSGGHRASLEGPRKLPRKPRFRRDSDADAKQQGQDREAGVPGRPGGWAR